MPFCRFRCVGCDRMYPIPQSSPDAVITATSPASRGSRKVCRVSIYLPVSLRRRPQSALSCWIPSRLPRKSNTFSYVPDQGSYVAHCGNPFGIGVSRRPACLALSVSSGRKWFAIESQPLPLTSTHWSGPETIVINPRSNPLGLFLSTTWPPLRRCRVRRLIRRYGIKRIPSAPFPMRTVQQRASRRCARCRHLR